MRCDQEMCASWTGEGCTCAVLDLERRSLGCGCGQMFEFDRQLRDHIESCDYYDESGGTR